MAFPCPRHYVDSSHKCFGAFVYPMIGLETQTDPNSIPALPDFVFHFNFLLIPRINFQDLHEKSRDTFLSLSQSFFQFLGSFVHHFRIRSISKSKLIILITLSLLSSSTVFNLSFLLFFNHILLMSCLANAFC